MGFNTSVAVFQSRLPQLCINHLAIQLRPYSAGFAAYSFLDVTQRDQMCRLWRLIDFFPLIDFLQRLFSTARTLRRSILYRISYSISIHGDHWSERQCDCGQTSTSSGQSGRMQLSCDQVNSAVQNTAMICLFSRGPHSQPASQSAPRLLLKAKSATLVAVFNSDAVAAD